MEHVYVIRPRRPGVAERARDFWLYRHLLGYFGRRFLEKRYARTWLGWVWLPLRPFLENNFVRGAVSGLGVVNLFAGFADLAYLFGVRAPRPGEVSLHDET